MILTKEQIGRLHANETVLHTEPIRPSHQQQLADGRVLQRCPWTPGRVYSIQIAVGKPAACRAEVLEAGVDGEVWTAWLRIIRTREQAPRFLAQRSQHGYTQHRHRALDGVEAVDPDVQERISKIARDVEQVRRAEQHAEARAKSIARRLRQEALEAIRNGHDPGPHLTVIETHLDKLREERAA